MMFDSARVLVTGLGVTGVAVVQGLLRLGARVDVVEDRPATAELGVPLVQRQDVRPDAYDLVVTSPGWLPTDPLLLALAQAGVEVIGDVELAWRVDQHRSQIEGDAAPRWLTLTGTNGKTTTIGMLASILQSAGVHAIAAGNVARPLIEVVMAEPRYEALAIELSSVQLHWSPSIRPHAGALINIAEDHLDWHGSIAAYADAKVRLLRQSELSILNGDDAGAVEFSRGTKVSVVVTRDIPQAGEVGVVEDLVVDRAFVDPQAAEELATLADITPAAPHNITNALIAAALARSIGVHPASVAAGLREYRSDGHRIEQIASREGVDYVDDSKATNPHAAAASIAAFSSVVWIAGGLAKGAAMDDLVSSVHPRLRAVVLIGTDRDRIADTLARHAPKVPIVRVDARDTEGVSGKDDPAFMAEVVRAASALAKPGDTVLLAPACASMDQFTSYAHRGRLFAQAARELP